MQAPLGCDGARSQRLPSCPVNDANRIGQQLKHPLFAVHFIDPKIGRIAILQSSGVYHNVPSPSNQLFGRLPKEVVNYLFPKAEPDYPEVLVGKAQYSVGLSHPVFTHQGLVRHPNVDNVGGGVQILCPMFQRAEVR